MTGYADYRIGHPRLDPTYGQPTTVVDVRSRWESPAAKPGVAKRRNGRSQQQAHRAPDAQYRSPAVDTMLQSLQRLK